MTSTVSIAKLTQTEALAELQRCAGTQFDPTVVDALADELEHDYRQDLVPAAAAS